MRSAPGVQMALLHGAAALDETEDAWLQHCQHQARENTIKNSMKKKKKLHKVVFLVPPLPPQSRARECGRARLTRPRHSSGNIKVTEKTAVPDMM